LSCRLFKKRPAGGRQAWCVCEVWLFSDSGQVTSGADGLTDGPNGQVHGRVADGEFHLARSLGDKILALVHPLAQAGDDIMFGHLFLLGFLRVFKIRDKHTPGVAENTLDPASGNTFPWTIKTFRIAPGQKNSWYIQVQARCATVGL